MKNRIRVLRAEREMTQEKLAELIGVTRNTIISLEKGKYYPSLKLAYRIADVFGVGIDDVFTYEREIDGPEAGDDL
ncbi:MAG TPA: helix-turn-helix transcriptional regulator [Methanoregulaceae archaeon]|jgi:putative transcriptional regulator|nr:helix-turn-helix transcriptional regulator [Methanolinea sp.]MCC7566806.1 helix-turn-helix transcriptional regulator [Methanoregulaceae archaeon]MDD3091200.1 helix-turn-helix transcriptional regulator [Methanoregulaceae archaeon]MDD5049227.1 helix-turn-helix transcriptional regulator [Methanoregulaceae archaeon]MDD5686148.1 helix-turn-helix transcriptional regulator [Methanoregulaceae archaeon]